MSSQPTFDYYAALEVERNATSQQLTSSFRRLALVHHPDKNPNNVEAATVTFQKIQIAYETLSDPKKRQSYDLGSSFQWPTQPSSTSAWQSSSAPPWRRHARSSNVYSNPFGQGYGQGYGQSYGQKSEAKEGVETEKQETQQ
ncbi:DnaJ domain-containing protein [Hypoxylon fuscum]|nr:DnaJ domain-containing protein [Hypoxylon fuscum]